MGVRKRKRDTKEAPQKRKKQKKAKKENLVETYAEYFKLPKHILFCPQNIKIGDANSTFEYDKVFESFLLILAEFWRDNEFEATGDGSRRTRL